MARKRDRTFAAFGAILFLVTSSALTVAVVIALINQSKDNKKADAANATNTSKGITCATKPKETAVSTTPLAGTQLVNFTPMDHIDKLSCDDMPAGTGQAVVASDTVTVDYTGAVAATGKIFQSSLDTGQPVSFPLSGVITGWTQGVPGMQIGGTRRLYIPANLAYGANPPSGSGIPANADLVFDITLHKIGQ